MSVNITNAFKIRTVATAESAATTAVNSDTVDMQGFDTVAFLAHFGTAATDNTLHVAQSTATGSGFSDLQGTSVNAKASSKSVLVEVYRPTKRYVRGEVVRGSSTTLDGITAIQGGARDLPVSNTATGAINSEIHATPTEGTA